MKHTKEYSRSAIATLTGALVLLAVPALVSAADTAAANGQTVDLGTAAVDGGTYSATTGGQITSEVTSLGSDDGTNLDIGEVTLSADGAGSTVDFSQVSGIGIDFQTDTRDKIAGTLTVQVSNGGKVDLSGMQHTLLYSKDRWDWDDLGIEDYMVSMTKRRKDFTDISVTGAGSVVDLSGVTDAGMGTLSVTDGATVDLSSARHLEFVDVTVSGGGKVLGTPEELNHSKVTIADAASSFDLSGIQEMKDTLLTIQDGTHVDLGSADINGSQFIVTDGSRISSSATSWQADSYMNDNYDITATGTDSKLDLSSLEKITVYHADGDFNVRMDIAAEDGGVIDLSGVKETTTGMGSDRMVVTAKAGTVDLSGLVSPESIEAVASDGGVIRLDNLKGYKGIGMTSIVAKTGGEIQVNNLQGWVDYFDAADGGTIRVGTSTAADYDAGAIVVGRDGTLGVIGSIKGNLYNAGNLGTDDYSDAMRLSGDFHQLATGSLNIDLGKYSGDRDSWNITGNAWLDGDLNLTLDDNLDVAIGDSWDIFSVDGTITGQFAALNLLSSSTFDFVLDYSDPNMISIVAQAAGTTPVDPANPVPLPATFWLMGSGLAYLAGRRKMAKK